MCVFGIWALQSGDSWQEARILVAVWQYLKVKGGPGNNPSFSPYSSDTHLDTVPKKARWVFVMAYKTRQAWSILQKCKESIYQPCLTYGPGRWAVVVIIEYVQLLHTKGGGGGFIIHFGCCGVIRRLQCCLSTLPAAIIHWYTLSWEPLTAPPSFMLITLPLSQNKLHFLFARAVKITAAGRVIVFFWFISK